MSSVAVSELLAFGGEHAALRLVTPEADLERTIDRPRIQKSGLALAGHPFGIDPRRIQILGETEMTYLDGLDPQARARAVDGFFALGLSCVVVTRDVSPSAELLEAARATRTALVVSPSRSSTTITTLHDYLDDRLAPTTTVHGGLVDVFGLGVLLLGKSGIGKSEAALDLVARGHRLVADDVVRLSLRPRREIVGSPVGMLRHHLEVRGLGILNVRELFGVVAVADNKRVNLVVELVEWSDDEPYDRLGIDEKQHVLLGEQRPLVTIPVRPGRDMAVIVEIAARNELLKQTGHSSAERFAAELDRQLAKGRR